MLIRNANVFSENGSFVQKDIVIDGSFFSVYSTHDIMIDATGYYAIPGLIDTHLHGCVGLDFSLADPSDVRLMLDYQAANGVTAVCPTTMAMPEQTMLEACECLSRSSSEYGADILGIHLEGPFVSKEYMGAQNSDYALQPDIKLLTRLQHAARGLIKQISMAPELPGAMDISRKLYNVICSIAHSNADYECAMEAFQNGFDKVTHIYNAMTPFTHRAPGIVGAACDSPNCMVELICNGIHIHPSVVRTTFELFGDDRIVLVSDSISATGLHDGDYELAGQPVTVCGCVATMAGTDTLAGSVTNLMDCVRNAVNMGIPLYSAVKCATLNAAKSVGAERRRGSITPGKFADLLLLDQNLEIHSIYLHGTRLL